MKLRVNLRSWHDFDGRTHAGRVARSLRKDLIASLGGKDKVSAQRLLLIDMIVMAKMTLDQLDIYLAEMSTLVGRGGTVRSIVTQRYQQAEHLARLLDRIGLDKAGKRSAEGESIADLTAKILARRHAS
jgi:hypothetical protein